MKIYLSGSITSFEKDPAKKAHEELQNKHRFYLKTEELEALGHDVYNPCKVESGRENYEEVLIKDVDWMYNNRWDILYVMRGSEHSHGRNLEIEIAKKQGKNVVYEVA
jgi:D-alanyl-D-alanine dipeptidase